MPTPADVVPWTRRGAFCETSPMRRYRRYHRECSPTSLCTSSTFFSCRLPTVGRYHYQTMSVCVVGSVAKERSLSSQAADALHQDVITPGWDSCPCRFDVSSAGLDAFCSRPKLPERSHYWMGMKFYDAIRILKLDFARKVRRHLGFLRHKATKKCECRVKPTRCFLAPPSQSA